MTEREVPVLIVGAGPVGMTASLLLTELGIGHRLVERRAGPHRAPQAHVVNPRTLEIFRALGIDAATLRARATPRADGSAVSWVTTLAGEELGRLPYERQGDDAFAVTPTPLLNLPQHHLEPILLATLAARGSAVHYGHQWEALEQDATGVSSRVRDLARDTVYTVRSRWLLAADGAGSRVRRALGIEMTGPPRIQDFLMIHFAANLRPLVEERPAILYWTLDPECTGALVAHDIDRTWVFMHQWDPDTETEAAYTPERCAALVRRAIGRADVALTVCDVSPWTMTLQVADRYADGHVFLVGDSAHRFPPSGGLGMNTGIQDAHNLAWKLAAVADGRAAHALLASYERERRAVAHENAEQSGVNAMKLLEVLAALDLPGDPATARARMTARLADAAGRAGVRAAIEHQRDHFDMLGLQLGFSYDAGAVVPDASPKPSVENPVRDFVPTTRPGARLPHAWVERDGATVSTLDLVPYRGFTLLVGPQAQAWVDAAATLRDVPLRCLVAGIDFRDPAGDWARLCGIGPEGAILVRPDQHVAWRAPGSHADPGRELARVLTAVLRPS